jgi:hypothetical protein
LPPLRSSPLDELLQTAALENKPAASQQPSSSHHLLPFVAVLEETKKPIPAPKFLKKKTGEKK